VGKFREVERVFAKGPGEKNRTKGAPLTSKGGLRKEDAEKRINILGKRGKEGPDPEKGRKRTSA